jgi:thymidylate synthase (FAD)
VWYNSMLQDEKNYQTLLAQGWTPQQARSVLPNSLKTEIVVTANLREWRHILNLRTAKAAHPQMREIMIPLLEEVGEAIPVLFEDIYNDLQG